MGEPVKLHKGKDEQTVYAPSEVQRLLGEGYQLGEPKPEPETKPEDTKTPAKTTTKRRTTRKKTASS